MINYKIRNLGCGFVIFKPIILLNAQKPVFANPLE